MHSERPKLYTEFNPIALRKAKIEYNFGLSECSRVKISVFETTNFHGIFQSNNINYNCSCYCDGGWQCQDGEYAGDYCSGCQTDGFTFAGNSSFQLSRGCELYKDCYCNCGGKWECAGDDIEDTCGLCR